MTNSDKNPKVDFFFLKEEKWKAETEQLRTIALSTGLIEELKWGCPCYTFQKRNIVLIHTFKDYCALLFFKGALLSDKKGLLIQQTKNVQAARQLRFTSVSEVIKNQAAIKAYIFEAIEIEKAGLKVELKKTASFEMPDELKKALKEDKVLNEAFKALTPGRQRGYILFFASATQATTRQARIKKYRPAILAGKGLRD